MALNIELFGKIKERITGEPKSFNMESWFDRDDCGTVMCIGAWAAYLSEVKLNISQSEMAELLWIEDGREGYLFFLDNWHDDFRANYYEARNHKNYYEQAKVTCDYIDWFIENYDELETMNFEASEE